MTYAEILLIIERCLWKAYARGVIQKEIDCVGVMQEIEKNLEKFINDELNRLKGGGEK